MVKAICHNVTIFKDLKQDVLIFFGVLGALDELSPRLHQLHQVIVGISLAQVRVVENSVLGLALQPLAHLLLGIHCEHVALCLLEAVLNLFPVRVVLGRLDHHGSVAREVHLLYLCNETLFLGERGCNFTHMLHNLLVVQIDEAVVVHDGEFLFICQLVKLLSIYRILRLWLWLAWSGSIDDWRRHARWQSGPAVLWTYIMRSGLTYYIST